MQLILSLIRMTGFFFYPIHRTIRNIKDRELTHTVELMKYFFSYSLLYLTEKTINKVFLDNQPSIFIVLVFTYLNYLLVVDDFINASWLTDKLIKSIDMKRLKMISSYLDLDYLTNKWVIRPVIEHIKRIQMDIKRRLEKTKEIKKANETLISGGSTMSGMTVSRFSFDSSKESIEEEEPDWIKQMDTDISFIEE